MANQDKENSRPWMQNKQILPVSGNAAGRSGSATSSAGGRQHKLKQRFTVIRKLGKGTYGKVQLAVNKETGQEVAIKTIKKTKIENEQDLERVRREIQIMSSIEHPHIIHIYEVFENKDKIVLIMQYAPGGELYEYVSQSKVLDEAEARRLFRQIATAIYYCHKNKICHRDLKLENILLDEKNNAKLADFGLSNVFDKSRQLKTFCGSPLYASPEIVQGSPYEGPEVDCWSLGVLLYTLVYGAMPFDGSNFKRLVKQISEACYYEPKQRSQASPLIGRLLCADPLNRATIFDICQDPWVNGHLPLFTPTLSSPTAAAQQRPISPNSCGVHQQQAHTSLLKVAQDMASLTPVRLDILLALTPNQVEPVSSRKETIAQNQDQVGEVQAKVSQENQRQQQERLMDRLEGSSLMEVDENRATSPVASYIVRDLAAKSQQTDQTNEQTQSCQIVGGEPEQPVSASDEQAAHEVAMETDEQPELEPQDCTRDVGDAELVTSQDEQADSDEKVEVREPQNEIAIDEKPAEEELGAEIVQRAPEKSEMVQKSQAAEQETQVEIISEPRAEVVASVDRAPGEPLNETCDLQQEVAAKSSDEPVGVKLESPADQVPEETKEKPKKVKKKIIVVKKKRKIAKKEAPDQEGVNDENAGSREKSMEPEEGSTPAKSQKSAGPGKVRIPDTFQPSGVEPAPSSTTLTRAGRRQSAFIVDVSHKLLQQQQHQHASSAVTIEVDQPQLASVRVCDKKDEFERRVSLAASQQRPQMRSVSPRGSVQISVTSEGLAPQASDDKTFSEPQMVPGLRESLMVLESIGQTIVEPVDRQWPLATGELSATHAKRLAPSCEATASDPITPTGVEGARPTLEPAGELGRLVSERLDALEPGAAPGDDRSDSVETIKAELEQEPCQPRVRSSLQIDLSGLRQPCRADEAAQWSQASNRTGASSIAGPAPISRSYKKVTFTKDGSCVTETGRIYSTRGDDGTVRRVERKSKVTHYPSDTEAAASQAGRESRAVEETHEEVVYEGGGGPTNFWPGGLPRNRPIERLIMPSSSYLCNGHLLRNNNDQDDDADEAARCDEFGDSDMMEQQRRQDGTDSGSSCSSGSTDVFDDIFDTWTGAISMFGRHANRHLPGLRSSLINRAFAGGSLFGAAPSPGSARHRPQSGGPSFNRASQGSASLAGTPQARDERGASLGPSASFFDTPDGLPRVQRHHHRHHQHHRPNRRRNAPHMASGRCSADASGYESDVAHDGRPASAAAGAAPRSSTLTSARGTFGSSNLGNLLRHTPIGATESLFDDDLTTGPTESLLHSLNQQMGLDPFGGSLIMQEMQLEHERMRRKMAQRHGQLWKGSTPSLHHELPDDDQLFSVSPIPRQASPASQPVFLSRANSSLSGSQGGAPPPQQHQQQHQKRVVTTVYKTLQGPVPPVHQSQSSGGMRQSLRQSAPLDSAPMRRNTANLAEYHLPPIATRPSTSKTSLLANQMARVRLHDGPTEASQAEERRHASSASFIELKRNSSSSFAGQQQQQRPQQPATGLPRLGQQRASAGSLAASHNEERAMQAGAYSAGREVSQQESDQLWGQHEAEANSRIQNWLQQSSGDLSVSSGSKSSATDTQPWSSQSGSMGQMLHRDGSPGSSSPFSQPFQRRQHHLPPAPPAHLAGERSFVSSTSRQSLAMGAESAAAATTTATSASSMTVRSSSKQSMSTTKAGLAGDPEAESVEQKQRIATQETIVVNSLEGVELSESGELFARQSTSSNTAQVSSHSTLKFAFPCDGPERREVSKRQEVVSTTTTRTSQHQVVSNRVTSPQQQAGGLQQRQALVTDDGFNEDFDSLVGSGADLESISSCSLLDQLRARGYRSMINQRMVNTQHQQPTQIGGEPNVITTSSTSITMSSSGVGGVQQEEEQVARAPHEPSRPDCNHVVGEDGPTRLEAEPLAEPELKPVLNGVPSAERGHANPSDSLKPAHLADPMPSDEDEDVREAKASIRGHLDRMRETERFLLAVQEDEAKFQSQRRDMLLLNSLLLGRRPNGAMTLPPVTQVTSNHAHGAELGSSMLTAPTRAAPTGGLRSLGHMSAPVKGHYATLEHPSSNAFMSEVSCFSSDMFKPTMTVPTMSAPYRPRSPLGTDQSLDPLLEPLAPIQTSWRRSKSQLGDQFTSDLGGPSFRYRRASHYNELSSAAKPRRGRPLSANIDSLSLVGAGSGSPFLPSRQRRSLSQMRHSTIVAPVANNFDSHTVSEYRSAFGPNLMSSPGVVARRSPTRRATSPLFSAGSRHHEQRANMSAANGDANVPVNGTEYNEDNDDDDDELRDYRASSYVPKVVPDLSSPAGQRRGRSLSRRSSTLELGLNSTELLARGDTLELAESRRKSLQVLPKLRAELAGGERERSISPVAGRRHGSLAGSHERLAAGENSRLSELEQRIQANKRRRQELLSDIRQGALAPPSRSGRKGSSGGLEQVGGDESDSEAQSFGLERPDRRQCAARLACQSQASPVRSADGATGSPRARPSRLESMEARIKRRSYCIRVSSPEKPRRTPAGKEAD